MKIRFLLLIFAFLSPAFAQTPAPGSAPASVEIPAKPSLDVTRRGDEARLEWSLPEGLAIRAIEVMRNTQADPKGRTRIETLRAHVRAHSDLPPSATAAYWYWIKVGLADGSHLNIGPTALPAADASAPAKQTTERIHR